MAALFFDALEQNAERLPELKALDVPGQANLGPVRSLHHRRLAERRQSQLKHASLTVVPAGHWLQVDQPAQVG
jgi:haloalkane dehalogenase